MLIMLSDILLLSKIFFQNKYMLFVKDISEKAWFQGVYSFNKNGRCNSKCRKGVVEIPWPLN